MTAALKPATLKNDWRTWAVSIGLFSGVVSVTPLRLKLIALASVAGAWALWWLVQTPHRWIGAFLVSALILPPLPIELGNSGPHICLLAAFAGVLVGAGQRWIIPRGPLTRAFLFLFFVLLSSTCMAALLSGVAVAAGSLVRVMLLGISIYLYFQVRTSRHDAYNGPRADARADARFLRMIFIAGMISALFACLDFYFQFPTPAGFAPQFVWLSSGVFRRAQGVFYEASTLGNVCAFFLVMVIVAFSRGKQASPLPRPLLICGAGLFATALILSYSRASLVNVAVALAALLFLQRGRFRWTRVGPAVAALAITGALAVTWLFPTLSEAYWQRASSVTSVFSSPEGVLSGRVGNWESLVGFLQQYPGYALLGIGYKTIPYSDLFGGRVVSDNVYLGMLVEAGILGLAAVLWLNATILRSAYRAAHSLNGTTAFFGIWIFCFWAGETVQMLSGDLLTYWRVLPLYFWALAIAARGYHEDPDRGPV
jgi:O-antigen ligase